MLSSVTVRFRVMLFIMKALETAQSMEMANKEDFRDVRSPLDESLNKVSKFNNGKPPSDVRRGCFRCGQRHQPSVCDCRFRVAQCFKCQRKGHVTKMCSFQKREPPSTRYVQDVSKVMNMNENASEVEGVDGEMVGLGLYAINSKGNSGYKVQLSLEGKQVTIEVDTGSAVFIMSETEYNNLFKNFPLQPTTLQLRNYSGKRLPLMGGVSGVCEVSISRITVATDCSKGGQAGPTWKLDWANIFRVTQENAAVGITSRYAALFESGYGHLKQFKASIKIQEQAYFPEGTTGPLCPQGQSGTRVAATGRGGDYLQGESK